MYKQFPINPTLYYMKKEGDNLIIALKSSKGVTERKYKDVPIEIIGKLFYLNSAKECLSYYSKEIKGKFTVLTVTKK